jgi:hypothetical protein
MSLYYEFIGDMMAIEIVLQKWLSSSSEALK